MKKDISREDVAEFISDILGGAPNILNYTEDDLHALSIVNFRYNREEAIKKMVEALEFYSDGNYREINGKGNTESFIAIEALEAWKDANK